MKRIPTVVELGYVHARCVGGSVPWHHVMRWAGEIRWGITLQASARVTRHHAIPE